MLDNIYIKNILVTNVDWLSSRIYQSKKIKESIKSIK